jgi:hypothetical protein
MICGEHGCPTDQCAEFTHAEDHADEVRAFVKGLARGLELAFKSGVQLEGRRAEIAHLLRIIRERL